MKKDSIILPDELDDEFYRIVFAVSGGDLDLFLETSRRSGGSQLVGELPQEADHQAA
jgi:hypothetical protein